MGVDVDVVEADRRRQGAAWPERKRQPWSSTAFQLSTFCARSSDWLPITSAFRKSRRPLLVHRDSGKAAPKCTAASTGSCSGSRSRAMLFGSCLDVLVSASPGLGLRPLARPTSWAIATLWAMGNPGQRRTQKGLTGTSNTSTRHVLTCTLYASNRTSSGANHEA